MKLSSRVRLGAALSTPLILTACDPMLSGNSSSTAPAKRPAVSGRSLEQIGNAIDYSDTLGSLSLRSQISVNLSQGGKVSVYNFTSSQIGKNVLTGMSTYFEEVARNKRPNVNDITIYPGNGNGQRDQVSVTLGLRSQTEHDVLLVPPKTRMPSGVSSSTPATTIVNANRPNAISVVKYPGPKDGKTSNNTGLPTELCQSIVTVAHTSPVAGVSSELSQQLSQETECNFLGYAVGSAVSGDSYQQYTNNAPFGGSVVRDGKEFTVETILVPNSEYAAIQQLLHKA